MEFARRPFVWGILVLFCLCEYSVSLDVDLTIEIAPGTQECFHEEFKKETTVDVEYQVIDGGDLDINFSVQGPGKQLLVADARKQDSLHKVEIKMLGTYSFCFDNTFSRMSRKVVFFEILSDDDDDDDSDDWKPNKEEIADLMDMTVEDFKALMDSVKFNLEKSIQLQGMLRAHEARDRNVQEGNFDRVNTLSCIQLLIMIVVGLVQVALIRSLFDDKSKISRIFKQRS